MFKQAPLRGSHLCHGVRGLRLLSPDCRVRRQCDAGGRVAGRLGPLDADRGRRRVDGQPRTPGRKHCNIKSIQARIVKH